MSDYLLEIGLEEVPAGMINDVIFQLKNKITDSLNERNIDFKDCVVYGTPRRIALRLEGIAEKGKSTIMENKGPSLKAAYSESEPTKALLGFCRGQGITPDQLVVKKFNNEDYVYAVKQLAGSEVKDELGDIVVAAISSINFRKPMYWGEGKVAFIRPVRTLVSLWNDEILPLSFAGIEAGRNSRGHRFLCEGEITINNANDYEEALSKGFVVVDIDKRRQMIKDGIAAIEEDLGFEAIITDKLLEEVLFLVEYPTVFLGKFEEAYLKLPKEVITTTMVNNQKYFPVTDNDGNLLNYFLGVRCGNTHSLDKVASGNEKVLKARLEDARFFFEEDQKTSLLSLREKLDKVIYQKDLGTIGDKIDRIVAISSYLGNKLNHKDESLITAARLSKMDLATHMVYEFPELQGIMGSYYSKLEGYPENISRSIREHYMPVNAGDEVAGTIEGIIVGIADKIDSITSIFKAGLIPSGSQDPYALRRMALGIIRTVIENKLSISLVDLLKFSQEQTSMLKDLEIEVFTDFLKTRFRSYLEKEDFRYDLIDSIFELDFDNLLDTYDKAAALKEYSHNDNFEKVTGIFVRISNIVKNNKDYSYDESILTEKEEQEASLVLKGISARYDVLYANRDYLGCYALLEELKQPLDAFFENVMVMVEDEITRNNRIKLLCAIKLLGDRLFNASKIVI